MAWEAWKGIVQNVECGGMGMKGVGGTHIKNSSDKYGRARVQRNGSG